jgi:hypothetical protein
MLKSTYYTLFTVDLETGGQSIVQDFASEAEAHEHAQQMIEESDEDDIRYLVLPTYGRPRTTKDVQEAMLERAALDREAAKIQPAGKKKTSKTKPAES